MAKIIVAFAERESAERVAGALRQSGYDVFRVCVSGGEALRAFNQLEDGLLVCGARLMDRTADALISDLSGKALVLVLGRAEQIALVESREAFRLKLPASAAELTAAVDMLQQLHYMRLPHRSGVERAEVNRAKEKLMAEQGLTEPEAHRFLQQLSMRSGLPMREAAQRVLGGQTVYPDD